MSQLPEIGTVPEWTLLDRLRKAREWAGLSQEGLGQRLGIGRSTVSNYEAGTTPPKQHMIMSWAIACGVPIKWLQTGRAPMAPDPEQLPRLDSNQEPAGNRLFVLQMAAA